MSYLHVCIFVGEIYVNKELDREHTPEYELTILATDGAFVSSSLVTISILDDNDNTPVCHQVCIL